MKTLMLFFINAILIFHTFAQVPEEEIDFSSISLPKKIKVKSGDIKIISLPRLLFIDRISLEVRSSYICGGGNSFTVLFDGYIGYDGHVKQKVKVQKGFWTGYRNKIITAQRLTKTIEIRNDTNCAIKIRNIEILPRRFRSGSHHGSNHYVQLSEAASYVSMLQDMFIYLEDLVGDSDQITFITPMKKVTGRALAALNTLPDTHSTSREALKKVIAQLKVTKSFIDKIATIEATFEISQEIQSAELALKRML